MLTMKGWLISCKILFSFFTCSTCFKRITSAIAKIFIAQNLSVVLSRQRHTRPNVPVPVKIAKKNSWWDNWKNWKKIHIILKHIYSEFE